MFWPVFEPAENKCVKVSFSTVVTDRYFSFVTDGSSVALIAFLCYLFKYALAHTHMHLSTALTGELID